MNRPEQVTTNVIMEMIEEVAEQLREFVEDLGEEVIELTLLIEHRGALARMVGELMEIRSLLSLV